MSSKQIDTLKLFEICDHFLVKYYDNRPDEIIEITNKFKEYYKSSITDWTIDDLIHYEGPFRFAGFITYFKIHNKIDGINEWLTKLGYKETPYEALEYYKRNFFEIP